MIEKLLEEIGLTKGEVKVYLTLLKVGETTTGKIIKQAQISSGKIYEILDKLINKGLASFILKEKIKYFIAASPNRILDYLYEKQKDIKRKEEELFKLLPTILEQEKKSKKEYETKLFIGYKGIQTAIFEALEDLSNKDEVLAMGIISSKAKQYNLLWQKWHKQRINKKILCKAIFSDKNTYYYKFFKKLKFTQIKVLDNITPSAIDILKDRVLIFTYKDEPSCLSITNSDISQSFTSFFYNLWKISK